jgi:hypothetical protein
MNNQPTSVTNSNENTIFLNGKQLAEVLGVSPPSLTEAVKNEYNCGGYPVSEWAIVSDSGRIKGYDVPESLVSGEYQPIQKRANPDEIHPNKPNISPNKGQKSTSQTHNIIHNYSLLPEGENYVRPAGMITLPLVLKKALDKDSPQSRAVIGVLSALLGAITGHAVSNNATGAGIGALSGLGIAILMYKYINPYNDLSYPQALMQEVYNQKVITTPAQVANQSGFLPN